MQPAIPSALPIACLRWEGLIPLMGQANRALAHYAGLLLTLSNPEVLLTPMATQEAVLSSRIEGTQATFNEVLKAEAGELPPEPALALDYREIINYFHALQDAERALAQRPFSLNLLKTMHAQLLDSVRGHNKARGEFRREQNWIGQEGTPIGRAEFVPPTPLVLMEHLYAWEQYYHADAPDPLVQLAVVHAQFEVLHPFLDGNGRLGRILIPLFLFEKRLLNRPVFYLSSYLERRKDLYISRLRAIGREPNGWQRWCEFFLQAIAEQAVGNAAQIRSILELYKSYMQRAIDLTHSEHAVVLVDAIFERPIFNTTQLVRLPNMPSRQMLVNLLGKLAGDGLLQVAVAGRGRRPQIWSCNELIELCERTV